MSACRYDAATAGRHLVLGWRRPRAAMREAGGIGEGGRLCLVVLSAILVGLLDPGESGFPRLVAAGASNEGTPTVTLGQAALAGLGLLLLALLFYVLLAGALWLLTRRGAAKPSFAVLRSVVAVANWVSTLPIIVATSISTLIGFDVAGALLLLGLWTVYTALCLSEATGLDARAATRRTFASVILATAASAAAAAGGVGFYKALIPDDATAVVREKTP